MCSTCVHQGSRSPRARRQRIGVGLGSATPSTPDRSLPTKARNQRVASGNMDVWERTITIYIPDERLFCSNEDACSIHQQVNNTNRRPSRMCFGARAIWQDKTRKDLRIIGHGDVCALMRSRYPAWHMPSDGPANVSKGTSCAVPRKPL